MSSHLRVCYHLLLPLISTPYPRGSVKMARATINSMRNMKGSASLHGHPHTVDEKNPSSTKVVTYFSAKQSVAPLPSRPKRLNSLLKRAASSSTAISSCSCSSLYAGPQPTGPDGNILKSCLKKPSASADTDFLRSSSGDSHKVSFANVGIREYCRQVGDNPSVSSGCPLAIGWNFNCHGEIDIDTYEADRAIDRASARCGRLSPKQRENILIDIGGIPHTQIVQGQMQAYFDRHLRTETLVQIGGPCNAKYTSTRERLLVIKESAARKLERATKGISHSREQRKLWEAAHEAARQPCRRTI